MALLHVKLLKDDLVRFLQFHPLWIDHICIEIKSLAVRFQKRYGCIGCPTRAGDISEAYKGLGQLCE